MTTPDGCGAKRFDYVSARIADAECDVRRLRQIIDRQLSGQSEMADAVAGLIGEIDAIRCTLARARDVCEALLADEAER